MLKILLVVGGVWISLAFVFVFALAAASARSIPPQEVSQVPSSVAAPEAPQVQSTSPALSQRRRKIPWQLWKPARTWATGVSRFLSTFI